MGQFAIPIALALSAGTTAIGAASSAAAASRQNKAIRASMASQQQASSVQTKQLQRQTNVERDKEISISRQIAGRIRVHAAESGVGFGGSTEALQRQNVIDVSTNLGILDQNLTSNIDRVRSGLVADLTALQARRRSTTLDALMGGLSGLQTGLSIAGGINSIGSTGGTT